MKYAFVIGSSVFVVPNGVISYADVTGSREIIRVKTIYHDTNPASFFSVDVDIDDLHGNSIKLVNNRAEENPNLQVLTSRNRVQVLNPDGTTIINIQQMDDNSAMALEHNIVAELEVNAPVAVIRLFGDFKAGNLQISAENEKLFINDNGYATSALAGENELLFTVNGVML